MKIKNTIYLIAAALLTACVADDADWQLSAEQQQLIGQGVNFSATMADQFVTRTTYHHDGSFNEGDQMRIFRQYANDDGTTFDETKEIYRTYYLKMNYATGTAISLNSDWNPMAGKWKSDGPRPHSNHKDQTAGDSLTWENGRTVRFRAWGRSNLSGCLDSGTKESYYPDYTVSDWVTVSGPTQNIPLTMRHIASRIAFVYKPGNQFSSVELSFDSNDYADDELKQVMDVYNKMCMPAGVDDQTFLLTAMTQSRYNNTTSFKDFEKDTTGIVTMGKLSPSQITASVQHPVFNNNNGYQYMMTIPVDMSDEHGGQALVLPACTRFKVWLYDVNGNDIISGGKHEAKCHILKLGDILDKDKNKPFENGLTFKAGYSYSFSVGYQYDSLTVTAFDNFSWTNFNLEDQTAAPRQVDQDKFDYRWFNSAFKSAVDDANEKAEKAKADQSIKVDFTPVFEIGTQQAFMAFTDLVNGTKNFKTSGITRGEVRDTTGIVNSYWWIVDGKPDPMTKEDAEKLGYLFYYQFHPSISTQGAYIEELCVQDAFNFYDTQNKKKFEVKLTSDLDFNDWVLTSIGTDSSKPFRSFFNGNGHTLSNLNMGSGYLFDYVTDATITNLMIESTHNTCLLRSATSSGDTGWGCYIAGVSMLCPTATNAIATSLIGSSYVVGCIHVGSHVGSNGGALVGSASNLTMLGCMQAADGIAAGTGALLGAYASDAKSQFFAPQTASKLKWGSFMCNYYAVEKSPSTNAVGAITATYVPQQYIRGSKSHILKAKNDYLLGSDLKYSQLGSYMKQEMYGLAPWRAMNYAIWMYNSSDIGKKYPCSMWYHTSDVGYTHLYPTLYNSTEAPDGVSKWNPLEQNN